MCKTDKHISLEKMLAKMYGNSTYQIEARYGSVCVKNIIKSQIRHKLCCRFCRNAR